jgi:hypothetical protein
MNPKRLLILIGICLYFIIFLIHSEMISFPPSLSRKPEDGKSHYVSVKLGGQLGNQLFRIATTLAYAKDNGLTPLFPDLHLESDNISYNRDRIFFRLNSHESPLPLKPYKIDRLNYSKIPEGLKDITLDSGFFSWKYFDHHRNLILEQFAPSEEVTQRLETKYADLLSHPKTVGVHVRTYSKPVHEQGLHFVGWNYFERTLSQFPKDSLFIIFSDRINFCKANFKKRFPDLNFVFIEGNDHIDDFYLMTRMKALIMSKSTFSWWAAYLNQTPSLTVYAPVKSGVNFLSPQTKAFIKQLLLLSPTWNESEYLLPSWHIAFYDLEPFPEDIYDYDDVSTSVCPIDK